MKKLFILVVFICSCSFENGRLKQVDELMRSYHKQNRFDGSITIGNKNGVIYSKSFGWANRAWDITVSPSTRFDVCSLNKSFVGNMIMQLVEEGKMALDDKLSDYLAVDHPLARRITIHQMLTHTSGLPDYDQMADSLKGRQFERAKRMYFETEEFIQFISKLPMVGEPGGQFYYSNYAYHLLSIIIEKIEEKHFSEVLESRICQPLGLSDTYNPLDNYQVYRKVASSYQWRDTVYVKSPFIDYSIGRRIFSTAEDLYKWGLETTTPTLISDDSNQQMLTNHIGELNEVVSYGYGWAVFDGEGDYQMGRLELEGNYIIHGGATDGYRSMLVVYEEGEWIVAFLGNIGNRLDELEMAEHILRILIENA